MPRLKSGKKENGFTIIELIIFAAFIGILLALAISNVTKARISANEANAKKAMQVLRDAEVLYFEGDLDKNGVKDYTAQIGNLSTAGTLRCPSDHGSGCTDKDALVDGSFEDAVASGGGKADCKSPKTGYCIQFAQDVDGSDPLVLQENFGWKASMTSVDKTGREDFSVYEDGIIRCILSQQSTGKPGMFKAGRTSPACDDL
jgi:type II secretory pathway pseudopilin PulG